MDSSFASTLVAWDDYFTAVAGISATLIGLLFVALGLNPRIMTDVGPTGLRVWAGQTFHSFFVLLVLGLAGLVPSDDGQVLAITMIILGVQGIIRLFVDIRRVRRAGDHDWSGFSALTRFISPGLAYLFFLWSAQGILMEDPSALSWVIAIVFMLMISALASCWDLLQAVGNMQRDDPQSSSGA